MKKMMLAAAAFAAVTMSLPAAAQFAKPEDAVKYRKAAFTVMGTHFARVGAMVQGKAPYDAKAAAENIAIVHSVAHLPFAGFGPGTDKGETRAKPEIWSQPEKFKQAQDKMLAELDKLNTAAKAGNFDTLKAAFGPTGQACKACHDDYRKEDAK